MRHRNMLSVFLICSKRPRFSRSIVHSSPLRGKEILQNIGKPEKISVEYWTKIILVAKELKETLHKNKNTSFNYLDAKHVTLLFLKPHGRFLLAFTLACDLLGARKTVYRDRYFENQLHPADTGKVLSKLTNMFVVHGLHHDTLMKIVSNVSIPVFAASSDVHCLQKAMSDMMTFYETLNRLKGLTLAWIGPPSSLFNSYLILCSKFGINIQYTLICSYGGGRMSPVRRFEAQRLNSEDQTNSSMYSKEFKSAKETVAGADIIATSMHPDGSNRITSELLQNAKPDHVFMHSFPRSWSEVSDDVFNKENNLSWQTSENYLYVAMAFLLTSLHDYEPKSSESSL